MDLSEFQTNLIYIASSRPAKAFSLKRKKRKGRYQGLPVNHETVDRKAFHVCRGGGLGEQKVEMLGVKFKVLFGLPKYRSGRWARVPGMSLQSPCPQET